MTTLTLDDPASTPPPPADAITPSNDPTTAAAPVAKDNVSNPRPRRRSLAGSHNAPRPAGWTATRTVVLVVVVAVCWQAAASLTAQWTHEHGLRLAASAVEASVAPVVGSAALLAAESNAHQPANLPRPPPVSATTLRVMTYNFFLRPPFVSDYHGDSKDQRLSEFIARVLPRYDLLALQETFAGYSTRVSALEAAAAALGFVGHVRGPAGSFLRGGYLIDSGLLVLSRWPIVRHAKLTYSSAVTVDKLASKGASYSHHVHPTRQDLHLHVFNTHLQASYETEPDFETDASVRCRSEQLRELAEFVHDHVRAHAEVPPAHERRVERSGDVVEKDTVNERIASDAQLVPSDSDQIVLAAPAADSAPVPPPEDDTNGKIALSNDENDTADAPLAQHLILVCGDLNVNSKQTGQHEYRAMLETLARNGTYVVTDLLAAQNRDNYTQVPWEWLTHRRHQLTYDVLKREGARLDYMLLLEPVAEPTAATQWKFDVDIDPCHAENPEFVQLSDHMGVAATVALPVTPSALEE